MTDIITWEFPLPRTHTGMLLGNATTGLLIWGEHNRLKITIGRADFWDHRGGMPWTAKQNYHDIRKCLEANDEQGIRKIFATETENIPGQPLRPSVISAGRLDLVFDDNVTLLEGRLDLNTAEAVIVCRKDNREFETKIQLSMNRQLFWIDLPENEPIDILSVPSWEYLEECFKSISFEPPTMLNTPELSGWIQKLPADPTLCIGYRRNANTIFAATGRNQNTNDLQADMLELLDQAVSEGIEALVQANQQWWDSYWSDIPAIKIPSKKLDFCYRYGLYKFAGLTNPDGVPATLQGPWIEEYELPPWSSDYHFNINVQMCYWPAYKANRLSHLKPMFDLVWSWREKLRHNANAFIGIDDGYMLPHAVDDRCTCMGSFWTGTLDHGCTCWVATMMYQYVQYTGDMEFLQEIAFPFMKGAMRVYEAMLEKRGGKYVLPLSVSPEYRGADMDAWGQNASFQLAIIHRLCEDLITAAGLLKESSSPAWQDILNNLPKATLFSENGNERIALWEGTDLEESHRHHAHLAAISPFDSIDIYAPEWEQTVRRTIDHWIYQGMGLWSGWCVPWASMIYSRLNNGDMAEFLLEIWDRVFTNEGYGTLHDCNFAGFTLIGAPPSCSSGNFERGQEKMQMDAGMGVIVAVQDMLLHSRRGVIYAFPAIPQSWKNAEFKDMPCEGGFQISGTRSSYKTTEIKVKSRLGGILKLGNPWKDQNVLVTYASGKTQEISSAVLELALAQGESCTLTLK